MVTAFEALEKRPFLLALTLAAVPYLGLRLYLSSVMHAEATMAIAPNAEFLLVLFAAGAVVPAIFLAVVLRRLVRESESFELRALLEVYFSLVVVFAVTYAVLQASGMDPSFSGMQPIWGERGASGSEHTARLHAVFGDSLYLSVVTMTTVGYGDIVPVGLLAKTMTAVQGLLGIGFVGLVLGQYFSSCIACSPRGG
ncbi:MAG: potassium channel family protein [bacterium]|nr:potassium channel family protein [bacterium]